MDIEIKWHDEEKKVEFTIFGDQEVIVSWEHFYARSFVIDHLHWHGRYKSILSKKDQLHFYLMCDGFGKWDDELHFWSTVGYDWSHVRDSTYPTFLEIAKQIADKYWTQSFEQMIEQSYLDAKKLGINPPELLKKS